jgi:hypothetical protein
VGLLFGSALLSAATAIAVVLLLGRRLGPPAALWSVVCFTLFYLYLGAELTRDPWNPLVVVLPMVLFVVLSAGGASGSPAALFWAAVVGSFEVQTHVATGPAVATVLVTALVGLLVWGRHAIRGRVWTAPALAGGAGLVLMWLPPLVDAVHHHPSNAKLLFTFFTHPHPSHSLSEGVRTALAGATVVPFGSRPNGADILTRPGSRLVASVLIILALVIASIWIGRRRHVLFATWLSLLTGVALIAAIAGNSRVVGPIYAYLVMWQAFVPITLLLALGCALLGREGPEEADSVTPRMGRSGPTWLRVTEARVRGVAPVATVLVVVMAAVTGLALSHAVVLAAPASDKGHPSSSDPDVATVSHLVESALRPAERTVRITVATHLAWPMAAGLSLQLETDGRRTTVAGITNDWTTMFGPQRRSTGREDTDVELFIPGPNEVQGLPPEGDQIGSVGQVLVFLLRLH